MPISASQLLKGGSALARLLPNMPSVGNCAICGKPITDIHPDEVRIIQEGAVHDDCYFVGFNTEVEHHPIGHPGMHRG